MDNTRIIHTNLYSKIAHEVLRSVEGQLSDGIWESSPAMEKYWRFAYINTAPDGEVLIEISNKSYEHSVRTNRWTNNAFHDMSDTEVIKWFAAKMKQIIQIELKDNGSDKRDWKRDNADLFTDYLSYQEAISVSDVYFIYDFLMDRDTTRKYSADQQQKIKGEPKSEDQVKAEETRRSNLAKLEAELSEARQKLDIEKCMKIQDIEEEFSDKLHQLEAEYKSKCDKLKA